MIDNKGLQNVTRKKVALAVPDPKRAVTLALTLSPADPSPGDDVTVSGRLTDKASGKAVMGMPLRGYDSTDAALPNRRTSAKGAFRYLLSAPPRGKVTVYHDPTLAFRGGQRSVTISFPSQTSAQLSSSSVAFNRSVTVSGSTTPATSGTTMVLEHLEVWDGRVYWSELDRTKASATTGVYSFALSPADWWWEEGEHTVRVRRVAGTYDASSSTSLGLTVTAAVAPSVTVTSKPSSVKAGATFTVSGAVSPAPDWGYAELQYRDPDRGQWWPLASAELDADGTYTISDASLWDTGTWRLRVLGHDGHAEGFSSEFSVTVTS